MFSPLELFVVEEVIDLKAWRNSWRCLVSLHREWYVRLAGGWVRDGDPIELSERLIGHNMGAGHSSVSRWVARLEGHEVIRRVSQGRGSASSSWVVQNDVTKWADTARFTIPAKELALRIAALGNVPERPAFVPSTMGRAPALFVPSSWARAQNSRSALTYRRAQTGQTRGVVPSSMGEGTNCNAKVDRTFLISNSSSSREKASENVVKRAPISPPVERVIVAIEKQTNETLYRTSHFVSDLEKCITPENVEAAIAAVWTVKGNNLVTAVAVACGSTRPTEQPPTPKPTGAAYAITEMPQTIDLRTPEERDEELATFRAARQKIRA